MDALIFDFDGILVDSEPIHLASFQEILSRAGITLTEEDYFRTYIGFDDRDAIAEAGRLHEKNFTDAQVAELIAVKTRIVQEAFAHVSALPGVVDLVETVATAGIPQAVCSGALKDEVELASRTIGVRDHFKTIVAADMVTHSKPDPESYRLALQHLRDATGKHLRPARTLAVEDTAAGITAAHGAGLRVLAVTNSVSADLLAQADRVVDSLEAISLPDLESLTA